MLTSLAQLNYQLLGQRIDELLVTLQLAGCIFGVAIRRLVQLTLGVWTVLLGDFIVHWGRVGVVARQNLRQRCKHYKALQRFAYGLIFLCTNSQYIYYWGRSAMENQGLEWLKGVHSNCPFMGQSPG